MLIGTQPTRNFLFLHQRDAFDDFIDIQKYSKPIHGVVHCFTENREKLFCGVGHGLVC